MLKAVSTYIHIRERLQAAMAKKRASKDAANSFFKT